jgi:hypothetical protein
MWKKSGVIGSIYGIFAKIPADQADYRQPGADRFRAFAPACTVCLCRLMRLYGIGNLRLRTILLFPQKVSFGCFWGKFDSVRAMVAL